MVSFSSAAILLLASSVEGSDSIRRRLSFESIAGYEPKSLVTDHNAIDLDQAEMERQLALGTNQAFTVAKNIYENGAFSKSVATVTLSSAPTVPLNKGAVVIGQGADGEVRGKVYADYPANTATIQIQYQTISIQSSYVGCQVGANPNPNLEGCFTATGTLTIDGVASPVSYQYDPATQNSNERTIQGFSTGARDKMYTCENCPYVTYEKFYQYYGDYSYADSWVLAAFNGEETSLANGNADFGPYSEVGRTEAIKKGSAYMNVLMYVIREMEDALDDCQEGCTIENCNDDPVHAWDEAVAFYTGSLEGTDGAGSGKLLHALADKRCINFNTCGDLANSITGTSHVNLEIFKEFDAGLRKISSGECSSAKDNKERIEQMMFVPMIQGTLRYGYFAEYDTDAGEKAEAEGATFAAAVLPMVHACDEDDAEIIYDIMRVGGNDADFKAVKSAFERNYACMGVRCEDVGGLWDDVNGEYMQDAAPCSGSASSVGLSMGFLVSMSVGVVSAISMLF